MCENAAPKTHTEFVSLSRCSYVWILIYYCSCLIQVPYNTFSLLTRSTESCLTYLADHHDHLRLQHLDKGRFLLCENIDFDTRVRLIIVLL